MLQIAVRIADSKLERVNSGKVVQRLCHMENALKKAISDYHSVVSELSRLQAVLQQRDNVSASSTAAVKRLKHQLSLAHQELDSYRYAARKPNPIFASQHVLYDVHDFVIAFILGCFHCAGRNFLFLSLAVPVLHLYPSWTQNSFGTHGFLCVLMGLIHSLDFIRLQQVSKNSFRASECS